MSHILLIFEYKSKAYLKFVVEIRSETQDI